MKRMKSATHNNEHIVSDNMSKQSRELKTGFALVRNGIQLCAAVCATEYEEIPKNFQKVSRSRFQVRFVHKSAPSRGCQMALGNLEFFT